MRFFIGFIIMLFLCILDCTLIATRLSLVMVTAVSLTGNPVWVAVSGLGGVFCDLYQDTFPFYTFVYLYISLGCVYLGSMIFKKKLWVFFVVSLITLTGFMAILQGIGGILSAVLNSLSAPLFYAFLKKELNCEKI